MRKCFSLFLIFSACVYVMPCKAIHTLPGAADSSTLLLSKYEDTLKVLQYEKIKPHTNDAYKKQANDKFSAMLKKALMVPGSFTYPFDSITTMSKLTSPDKKFRIINWDVPRYDETIGFFGFIQSYNPKTQQYTLYELHDQGSASATAELSAGTPDKWFGMLYYKIIPSETEKDTYIMLAWQGYTGIITRKIIDILSFNAEGVPTFGKAIFRRPPAGYKSTAKRIVFQYSAQLYMSLEYNEGKKMIMYDHLAPPDPSLDGQYQFYGPSFQVDALTYTNKAWVCQENVDARNMPNRQDKTYHAEGAHTDQKNKTIYTPSH
jgi:hypothetical protein